jgi:polar amino acid transport system substrate-binding protein
MIHFLRFFSVYFLLASSSFLAHSTRQGTGTIHAIRARGTLIVAMLKEDDPPYSMKDSQGNMTGIDILIAKEIAHYLKVKVKILRSAPTYDAVVDQVVQGEADIAISNLSISLDRAGKVNFSNPYVSLKKAILFNQKTFMHLKKREKDSLKSIFQRGNKMGVLKGSAYAEFSKSEFPKAGHVLYDNWFRLIHDLDKGRIAGAFWDQFEIEKIILLHHRGPLHYMAVVIDSSEDKVAMVLPKNDLHFQNWINTFLEIRVQQMGSNDLLRFYMNHLKKKRELK